MKAGEHLQALAPPPSSAHVNGLMSFTLDLLGASSFLWRLKHNVMHHAYPNVEGLDPDIEAGSPLLRLAPWQPRGAHHRFQHLYVWLLYALFPLQWWFVDDLRELATGRIGGRHAFDRLTELQTIVIG